MINSQVIEHLMEDDIAIVELTRRNPNVYYEPPIRHGVDKPVVNIKDVSESLAFDIVGMRTIDVDFRYIDSMKKCKKEIIRQIQAIEDGTNTIDSPIKFTKQAKRIDDSISDLKRIGSEIESLKQGPTCENNRKVKDLYWEENLQFIKDNDKILLNSTFSYAS